MNAWESGPTSMTFNNDGTKMFIIGQSFDHVLEFNLSTAFDVSTAVVCSELLH